MPFLEFVMFWSEGCEACRRTKPIVHKVSTMFPDILFSYYKIVNSNYKIFLWKNASLSVEEDELLSPEEKQELLQKGITKSSSLPTFILRDYRNPFVVYEMISGGTLPQHIEKKKFEQMLIAMLNKYEDMSNHRSIIKFQYGEFEVRDDLWGG